MSDTWGKVSTLASGDHARGCQGRSYTCECGHDDAIQGALSFAKVEITRLRAEHDALLIALHDAIRRPMGVVPASADQFYSPAMADEAEAIRALKSPKPQED